MNDPEFHFTNSDGKEGMVRASLYGWGRDLRRGEPGPFMLHFEDAPWMEEKDVQALISWLKHTLVANRSLKRG